MIDSILRYSSNSILLSDSCSRFFSYLNLSSTKLPSSFSPLNLSALKYFITKFTHLVFYSLPKIVLVFEVFNVECCLRMLLTSTKSIQVWRMTETFAKKAPRHLGRPKFLYGPETNNSNQRLPINQSIYNPNY